MKKRLPGKIWIPFWVDKWLWGSMRIECTVEERAIWIDFIALAAKDEGWIRANEDIPYPDDQLAGMLRVPKDKLRKAINKFVRLKKLKRFPNKTLYMTEWEKYQFSDRHKRRVMSANGDIGSAKKDTITYNNKTKQKTKQNINTKDALKSFMKDNNFFILERRGIAQFFDVDIAFDELWYPYYPKKVAVEDAREAFRARVKEGLFEEIDKALTGYLNKLRMERERRGIEVKDQYDYILHPATFLRKRRWADYLGIKYVAPL